jgi:hypothetical protein
VAVITGTTCRDIIVRALEDVGVIGVGQTPLAADVNFGLSRFNAMIGQFNRRRWLVYHTVDVAAITTGLNVYSVGAGQQFNIPRPDKLEDGCYFRQTFGGARGASNSNAPFVNGTGDFNSDFNDDFSITAQLASQPPGFAVDYRLRLLQSREDWNSIPLKTMPSWPSFIFYDPANTMLVPPAGGAAVPTGFLYINPVPFAGMFELHILVKDVLSTLANLSTVLATPPEYEEAFEYNLAIRFAAKYNIDASKEVLGLAAASLATIRSANTQVPLLDLPAWLTSSGSRYNIFSDRSY